MTGASWDSQRCDNQSDDLHPPSIRGSAQDCRGMVNHSFYHPNSKTAALHPLQPEETQDGVQDTLTPLQVDHPDQLHQLLLPRKEIPTEGSESCPAHHQNGGGGTLRPLKQHPSSSCQFPLPLFTVPLFGLRIEFELLLPVPWQAMLLGNQSISAFNWF